MAETAQSTPFSNEIERAVDRFPTIASDAGEVLRAATHPLADSTVLLEIAERADPGLVRTLEIARRLGSVTRHAPPAALGDVDPETLAQIAVLAFVSPHPTCPHRGSVDPERLALHGLATALWAREILGTCGLEHSRCLFPAALLHDMGLGVLAEISWPELEACLNAVRTYELELVDAERQFYDPNHAEIGGTLCSNWMLPYRLSELITRHADAPRDGGTDLELATLRIAVALAERHGLPPLSFGKHSPVHPEDLDALQLADIERFDPLAARVHELARSIHDELSHG